MTQERDGISISKQALCQHLGIGYDSTMTLTTALSESESPLNLYIQPETAVENRSEYKMLSNVVKVEKLQKEITIGENLPQAAIGVAGYYLDMMDNSTTNSIAFATISIPITDWWEGKHKINQNRIKVANAVNQLEETAELLKLQVIQTNNELNQCYFQIEVAKKSVKQAEENLKITNDNYHAGVVSMSDLLEAQSAWLSALDSLTEAQCNYQIKKAEYLKETNRYK